MQICVVIRDEEEYKEEEYACSPSPWAHLCVAVRCAAVCTNIPNTKILNACSCTLDP